MSELPPLDASEPTREHRFPCDNCGADFRYDPTGRNLICDH